MANGSVRQYLEKNPGVNRLDLVRSNRGRRVPVLIWLQIIGVTRGLSYLHDNEVIHGDLKAVSGTPDLRIMLTSDTFPRKRFLSTRTEIRVYSVFIGVYST